MGSGSANRIPCNSAVKFVEFGILYIFMWSNATIFADKGFYIGDVFYFTEIGIQHYYLYNAKNVL
ncbi:hypothetical protein BMETH_1986_1 [methanotrophic bacterial endosymbiont of Bathymodiolus sp.]|nr:hypothetical protein BMETH_1986_1 [methanotrophic bacterial endosymbiont of Bathymodiolus sp.]